MMHIMNSQHMYISMKVINDIHYNATDHTIHECHTLLGTAMMGYDNIVGSKFASIYPIIIYKYKIITYCEYN